MSKRKAINFARRIAEQYRNSEKDRNTIVRELRDAGWSKIGRGAFAIVLAHRDYPEVVIKVGQPKSTNRFCMSDGLRDGFENYFNFLDASRSTSKFALKIYAFVHAWGIGEAYVAVIERLYRINGNNAASKAVTGANNLLKYGSTYTRVPADPWAKRFFERLQWHGKLDVHSKNLMKRLDGTVVVSDPLCIQGAAYHANY